MVPDRAGMLAAEAKSLKEVIAFPFNQAQRPL